MNIYLSQAQKPLQKPTKTKIENDRKIVRHAITVKFEWDWSCTKLPCQNDILLANGFVAKTNQIFGLYSAKQCYFREWSDVM